MPIVAKHVRLTNSGKLPDIFLTSKVQASADLADARLGKLYFVVQINAPWAHAASLGSSIINVIGREYYRQAGSVPLDDFERAIAKANRLIDQLAREGDQTLPENFHALVALVVGDELHIAFAGAAEAYFLRGGKLNLVTEPGIGNNEAAQTFNNLVTGELSNEDIILLGSPGLYSVITSDDLESALKQPLHAAGLALAKRLQAVRYRTANAIIIGIASLQGAENTALADEQETIYLDQRLESTWALVRYYSLMALRPLGQGLYWLAKYVQSGLIGLGRRLKELWQKTLQPKLKSWAKQTRENSQLSQRLTHLLHKLPKLPLLPNLPAIPRLSSIQIPNANQNKPGIPVHHYTAQKTSSKKFGLGRLPRPIPMITELGKQFRAAIRRSPRLWYMIIAFVLLGSIAASVQLRGENKADSPVANQATIEEMKSLIVEAKQAKIYGNSSKARQLYLEALAKGELVKSNPKLAGQAGNLLGSTKTELAGLAGATELTAATPLVTVPDVISTAAIHEGSLYYVTEGGDLKQLLLTGGEATSLADLPESQTAHQLLIDSANHQLHLQTYTGAVYSYNLINKKLSEQLLDQERFPISTGLGLFNNTLYLLDPAKSEIWKYPLAETDTKKLTPYLKTNKVNLANAVDLAIDGSIFTLDKTGKVIKFTRGNLADFAPAAVPEPFNKIANPLGFFADESADRYYLADRGNANLPPRIIELDKTGKFIHQYFLPQRWQDDIKQLIANPKNHRAWVLVEKELYEFTLLR